VYVDFTAQNQDFVLGKRFFTVELENPKIHMKIFNRRATLRILVDMKIGIRIQNSDSNLLTHERRTRLKGIVMPIAVASPRTSNEDNSVVHFRKSSHLQ
jgi:hypothetical protein